MMGRTTRTPAAPTLVVLLAGIASASAVAHGRTPAAAYNLFSITRGDGKWQCRQTVRAIDPDFRVRQIKQATLF